MLSPGERLGPYRIVARVGKGGMGEVYRATDTRMGRDVAIKVVPEDAMERFDREVRAIAALNHPNICTIHDVGPNYLVMEYVAGEPLRGPLPAHTALHMASQIAAALEAAHQRGIVHRDLKPGNILVTGDRVKLLDFGLATLRAAGRNVSPRHELSAEREAQLATTAVAQGSEAPTITMGPSIVDTGYTQPGTVLGTPAYMSPEQAAGVTADARSDIFSFGVVVYELLTGTAPFRGDSVLATLRSVCQDEAAPLETTPEISEVIARCLRKNPAGRFQTAAELRSALEQAAASLEQKSVAVLPFTLLGAGSESQYFGEGLAEDIITALSGVPGLKVIARTSSFAFRDRSMDVRAIAAALGVNQILDGSARMAGKHIRVNAQLISGQSGAQVWSKRYDRDLVDVFELQDEMASAIAAELKVSLARQDVAKAPAPPFPAYEAVLQGRHHFFLFDPAEQGKARVCFERALEIDPGYAAAHIGMALYHTGQMVLGIENPRQSLALQVNYAREALRLDPRNSEGHHVMASYYALHDFDWDRAEHHFARALELNPNSQWAYHCKTIYMLAPMGRSQEAVECQGRAVALDPLSLPILGNQALAFECVGDFEAEDACLERVHQIYPHAPTGQWMLARLRGRQGRAGEAIEIAERLVAQAGRWGMTLGTLGTAYAAGGRTDDAKKVLEELALEHNREARAFYSFLITSAMGDLDAAFHWATVSLERRDSLMVSFIWSTSFDDLRKDRRFARILNLLNLPHLAAEWQAV
jgi:serine/threonine protein kinase/Tfp pilus assembly protein PilF